MGEGANQRGRGLGAPSPAASLGPGWVRFGLPALMVLAAAMRWLRWQRNEVLFNDGPVFLALARTLASGSAETVLEHPFHPLYAACIAAFHVALGGPLGLSWETSGVLVSVLAGSAAVLAMYVFAKRAFGAREGLVAAGVVAFHAGAIEMGGDVQSEGLYLALFLASCAALWPALRDGSPRAAARAGLFSGLAYLTRPEGLGLALIGVGLAGALALGRRLAPARAAAVVAALGLAAATCVVPYVAALYAETGQLWLTRKKSVSWVAGLDGPPAQFTGAYTVEPDFEGPALGRGMERPNAGGAERPPDPGRPPAPHPGATAPEARPEGGAEEEGLLPADAGPGREVDPADDAGGRVPGLAALGDLLRTAWRAVRYELVLLLAAGLYAARGRPGLRALFVASVLLGYGVVLFGLARNVGYVSQRHVMPPISLLFGYVALGVSPWARWLGRWRGRPLPWLAVALGALALVAVLGLGKTLRRDGVDEIAERRAAEWLRAQHLEPGAVAVRKRRVAYYAGAPFVQLRPKNPMRLMHYLDSYRVRYVIVTQDDLEGEYAGLAPLIGDALEPLHEVEAEGERARVFRYVLARGS